jgi:glyceraldehyde 3-phosphate dehydrogenase
MIDLVFNSKKKVSVDQINDAMKKISSGSLKGVLNVSDQPLVSIDYNHNPASSTFDLTQTEVIGGRLGRVLSWYDNEWGFANRMSDTASVIGKLI